MESPVAGQGSGGIGLCNEFGIMTPIGFASTPVGENFPKLGVGLLHRADDKPYSFFRPYPITPFAMRWEAQAERAVTIVTEPAPCRGYAVRLRKEFVVEANRLDIRYRLENVGERPVATEEYTHNFLALNGAGIGPGYELETSFPLQFAALPEPLRQLAPGRLGFAAAPVKAFYGRIESPGAGANAWWRLTHTPGSAWVRETLDAPLAPFALWGVSHTMSPEAFVQIDLAPGQTLTWQRRYEFGA
jgi:hypothetical protein